MNKMPISCCCVSCTNRFSKDSNVRFYRFPEEQGRRQLWIKGLSRARWELKDHHHLCGEHFVSGCPSKDSENIDCTPTVFNDRKRRRVISKTPSREEKARKRAKTPKNHTKQQTSCWSCPAASRCHLGMLRNAAKQAPTQMCPSSSWSIRL